MPPLGGITPLTCTIFDPTYFGGISRNHVFHISPRGTGRPIYEFTYNGEIHKVAITVGNNGFIVGANPK